MRSAPSSAADRLLPRPVTAVPLVLAIVGLVVIPLFDLVRTTFAGGMTLGVDMEAVGNTLWTSAAGALLGSAIGVAAALATARDGAGVVRVMMLIPLLVPPFVSALAWTRAFGPGGLTDDLTGWTLPGLIGPGGIVVVLAVHAAPLVYLVVAAALTTRARPELEWAGRVSGAGAAAAFTRITLPLLAPAVAGGVLLAFVVSVNSFGIPAVLGVPAGFPTITTRIFADLARSADPAAFHRVLVLSTLLMALVVVAVAAAGGMLRRGAGDPPASGREPLAASPSRARPVLWGYLVLTTVIPLGALVLTGLTRAAGLDPWPANWTLANFAQAMRGDTSAAALRSLGLAAAAATAATALGLWVSLIGGRRRAGIGLAASAMFAVPGSALAVAVLVAYGPWLRDTLLIILIAYLAKFWALAQRVVAGSAVMVDRETIRAARASGAGGGVTLRKVVLPLLRPALLGAWLLVFLFGLHELTMSSLLYGPGTATLAVVTLEVQQLGEVGVTAALAVLLTVPGIAAAMVIARRRVSS